MIELLNQMQGWMPLLPAFILLLVALAILVLPNKPGFSAGFSIVATSLALCIALMATLSSDISLSRVYFEGALTWSQRGALAQSFILAMLLLSMLSALPLARQAGKYGTEFFALALFAALGAIQMVMSRHFLTLFLGMELLSLPLYVLCAFRKHQSRSREAGFKYFILGAFSAGLFLMGSAYLYGASGTLTFDGLQPHGGGFYLIGCVFLLASLAFKAALFPFHAWLPDVYEGAPAVVTGFMASAVKMAIFAVLLVLVYEFALFSSVAWTQTLKPLVIVSMTVANLAAIVQKSVKRMLAYSSIAHVAYTFIALLSASGDGGDLAARAVLFYVVVYGFASLGAFTVLSCLDAKEEAPFYYKRLHGLAKAQPMVALAFALFMVSLAGIPPVAGFMGKFYLFSAALASNHIDLAVAGIINSLISIYYYSRPVISMYMKETTSESSVAVVPWPTGLVLLITTLFTLLFGLMPAILYRMTGVL